MQPHQMIERRIYLGHGIPIDFRIFNEPTRKKPASPFWNTPQERRPPRPARIRHNDVGRCFFSYHRFTVKGAKKLTITIDVVRRAACTRQRRLLRRRFRERYRFFFVFLLLCSGSSLTRAPPGSLFHHRVKEQTGQLAASVASEMEKEKKTLINKREKRPVDTVGDAFFYCIVVYRGEKDENYASSEERNRKEKNERTEERIRK